jgi:hypothetical protein
MIYADTAHRFHQNLNMRQIAAKFMPHLLNDGRLSVQGSAKSGQKGKLPF